MIKSQYPLDHELGLTWYCSDSNGIGGRLKADPEDFVVDEIADHTFQEGPYLICRLTKRNWDQQRAIKEIANRLGFSHQRIGFAGTKDKRAVTTQYISIYKGDQERIRTLSLPDMSIEPVGTSNQQISLGQLKGNRFNIALKGTEGQGSYDAAQALINEISGGVPNYYGYQRFGVHRPVTHLTGLDILRGDYEAAVKTFVSTLSTNEDSEYSEGRQYYADTGDAKGALHLLPVRLSLERSLLHHLVSKPADYGGAFHAFPRTLRSMFVSAVQSWLFNKTVSMRFEEGRMADDPQLGDRLIFLDGKTDIVSESTRRIAVMHVKRGRCRVAVFMPGSLPESHSGPDDKNMAYLMEEQGITPDLFATASTFLETRFSGALRPIMLNTTVSTQKEEDKIRILFDLEPGQYATTVLREIMKADPVCMV
ncbi:MAG TPA: tRNA pseudouridine(13) synthase TruD [Methanospirillum sp.]|nr:tRNA pseudouridine(13) synthase TruD [Methanospirillum sp.]